MTTPDDGQAPPTAPWSVLLNRLLRREDLPSDEAAAAMDDIMAGRVGPARIAAFLIGLRAKGESPSEVSAAAEAMRRASRTWTGQGDCVDIVGTGGDNSGTVNISTLAAVIVAACGVRVVKHGNRAATSASGAADVLEALGVPIEADPQVAGAVADEVGLGFAFAPVFHPAMRFAAPVRRELGVPTVFNILGPLTNPARPIAGLIGCADARLAPIMAEVYAQRGEHMLVVRGDDGWDEITPVAPTRLWATAPGRVTQALLDPSDVGLEGITGNQLAGGSAMHNAEVARMVFGLPRTAPDLTVHADPAAVAAVAIANAAAALAAAAAAGIPGSDPADHRASAQWPDRIRSHLPQARAAVDSGAAGRLLVEWVDRARQLVDRSDRTD